MNGSPDAIAGLNDLPVRTVNGATTYLRDVAHVRDGFSPQTNIVRQDGAARRAALGAEERRRLDARHRRQPARRCCRARSAILPPDVKVTPLFDQSVFVKAAVKGVVLEALIAAALTAAMILLFLGNWRSTLIIALTIPLSILASILVLHALGETLNIMTLGGLALVGRHPGRRGDRRRSRTSSATCTWASRLARGDPRRRRRDRRAGVRLDAVHLHRVRADVLPDRRRALPVRAAGRGGRVRDARLVLPVAHAGADAGDAADARRARATRRARRREPLQRALPRASTAASSACARAYTLRCSRRCSRSAAASRRCSSASALLSLRAVPGARPRLLPERRRRPDPAARARADRHAHRGDRAHRRRVEAAIRELDPAGRARDDPRQPRRAEQRHQPLVQQRRHDRHARRRDPDRAEAKATARPTEYVDAAARASCRSASRASSSSSSRPTSSPRS